jgi:hypothetical protein
MLQCNPTQHNNKEKKRSLVFNRDGDIKAIFQLKKIKLKKLYFTNGE